MFGSLFLLLSILVMSSIMGTTDFDALYKTNYNYSTELFLFYGIFIAFAIKTPTIFLNSWLLKAHVESPLSGSIILAAISMVALNLANCWKHLAHIFTRSISRKLYAFTETKGYLTYIFWDEIALNLKYVNLWKGDCLKLWCGVFINKDDGYNSQCELHDLKLLFNMINIKLNRISRGHTLEVINANKDSVGSIHEFKTNTTGEYLDKNSHSG